MNTERFDKILSKKEGNFIKNEDFKDKYPELFEPIGKEVVQEDGMLTYENEKMNVAFRLEEFAFQDFDDPKYLELLLFFSRGRLAGENYSENYLRLTSFELKNNHAKYDLASEGKNPVILVKKPNTPDSRRGSIANIEANIVVLEMFPNSPEGILTLGHELGHINDDQIILDNGRKSELRSNAMFAGGASGIMDKERDAITLRQERFAWAYALGKLRPFIKDFEVPERSVDSFVHDFTLGSHCHYMSKDYED